MIAAKILLNGLILFIFFSATNGKIISGLPEILIIKEQGIGDEILYSSMYPDLLKKFPDSKIETENRLISIFQKSFGYKNNFVHFFRYSKNTNEIKKFDKILYAGSLGRLFRNKISDFPNKNFLYVDNSIIKIASEMLQVILKI